MATSQQIATLPDGAVMLDHHWLATPTCFVRLDGLANIRTYAWDTCDGCNATGWVSRSFADCFGTLPLVSTCVSCASVEVIETTAALLSHNL